MGAKPLQKAVVLRLVSTSAVARLFTDSVNFVFVLYFSPTLPQQSMSLSCFAVVAIVVVKVFVFPCCINK